jgi:hypothetical protein
MVYGVWVEFKAEAMNVSKAKLLSESLDRGACQLDKPH